MNDEIDEIERLEVSAAGHEEEAARHRKRVAKMGGLVTPQPAPGASDRPSVHDLVVEDVRGRKAFGLGKYGTLLQTFNGRDALVDAYQEFLDWGCYFRQLIDERDLLPDVACALALELGRAEAENEKLTNENRRLGSYGAFVCEQKKNRDLRARLLEVYAERDEARQTSEHGRRLARELGAERDAALSDLSAARRTIAALQEEAAALVKSLAAEQTRRADAERDLARAIGEVSPALRHAHTDEFTTPKPPEGA